MKFPDFIIAGSNKCGTTALWYNLDKHPDITMATRSKNSIELKFWGCKWWNNGIDWYKSRFTGDKLNGEKTPIYIRNKQRLELISKYIPNVKLIFCFRNPTNRAYSDFQMMFRGKKNVEFTFNKFKRTYSYPGLYHKQLMNNVLPYFNKNQIYICITEHLKNNTVEEMSKIFKFLKVTDIQLPVKEIHGNLLGKGHTRYDDIIQNRNEKFYRVWKKEYDPMPEDLKKQIDDFYKPENEKLFNFLGYRIEEWD